MNWLIKKICEFWEVGHNLPLIKIDLVVGMMLSLEKNGDVSSILDDIIKNCAKYSKLFNAPIVFANRFTVNGKNITTQAKRKAMEYGINENNIIIPHNPKKLIRLRNTFEEVRFASRLLRFSTDENRPKRFLVVANHLHMKRVLKAFLILNKGNFDNIGIYWANTNDDLGSYGENPAQIRFKHPLLFLIYEIFAFLYSKFKGWA